MFHSISEFRNSIEILCSKEKNGYHFCKSDICTAFKGLLFDDIWNLHWLIKDNSDIRIIKVRLQNAHQNLSSANGFRLIILCNRKNKTVTFLNIYPKRGKLAQADQSGSQYKSQLKKYASEFKEQKLVAHDIDQDLS